ncbi:MAG: exo-alpha-sialidase [Armatimonadetes bacterium]|nr:exo-alpha-sialidase [Armatimonadota bacterium]
MSRPDFCLSEDFSGCAAGPVAGRWSAPADTGWQFRELDRPAQNKEFWPAVYSPRMHVAFPVMDRCPQTGRLYVVYRQGYTHVPNSAARDGAVMMVTSDDGGETWSRPRCIYSDPDRDDRNAAVGVMRNGTVVVCWDQYLHGWHHRTLYMLSRDGGRTWTTPQRLGRTENLVSRSRPVELSDGRLLFPLYAHYGTEDLGCFAVFVDPATGEQEQVFVGRDPTTDTGDEWTAIELEPGHLLGLMRAETTPWLLETRSYDGGRSWSPPCPTEIPSQFAPCDLIKLPDGRLACSFSFRERRNERLAVSDDGGKTWDVENSLDIFDATTGIDDRSYVSSAVLDDHTVGSVLYETRPYPDGGIIWFARTDLSRYGAARRVCLYHPGGRQGDAVSTELPGGECMALVRYRFTGRFVDGTQGGIEVRLVGHGASAGFSYWMGIDAGRDWSVTNRWELAVQSSGQVRCFAGQARGDSFNDGNEHSLTLSWRGGRVSAAIDDHRQAEASGPGLDPRRLEIVAHNASIAVYQVEVLC